jgi:NADH-quinone oxidoreductase subunit N
MLLSLAGMPPLAGFIGKFYVVAAGIGGSLWVLVMLVIITSAIALYYYLRIIVAMYMQAPDPSAAPASGGPLSLLDGSVLAVLAVLLLGVGLYPAPLIGMIQAMAGAAF